MIAPKFNLRFDHRSDAEMLKFFGINDSPAFLINGDRGAGDASIILRALF